MNSSTLPDLVSFNMQQLSGTAANDGTNLTLPLPTPINFAQARLSLVGGQQSLPHPKQPEAQNSDSNGSKQQSTLGATATATPTTHVQQQQQIHHQQLQIQQQQQQARQPQQAQPQQQALGATSATPQPTQVAQQNSVAQPGSVPHNLAQHGAFSLFQQSALLAQSQNPKQQALAMGATIPTIVMPNVSQPGQEQRAEQHATQQFSFATDPSAFLRQLQVAQLQQQFNAVQARAMPQQVIGTTPSAAQVPPALQQQIQFQAQAPMVAQVPVAAAQQPQPQAAPSKKTRAQPMKKPPATQTSEPSQQTREKVAAKASIVSASDTDGELTSKIKASRKGTTEVVTARKKPEIDPANMTPEEKAKANRDRNREHARNTRLRKKAYLEKLKTTVDELCRERDTLVSERAGAANILVEMHSTRTEVLMSFFALRSANEKRRELWASILDESCFACVLPVTPYRSFPASEVQVSKCQRTIMGIDGMMSDTASLHVLLNSLVDRSRFPNATIVFRYTLVTEEAVVAGNQMMARWVMSTLNATQCGARMEVTKQGMLCCKFNSAHKIIGLELMFDVMALMLQLKQAAGSNTFSVIPNTVQTCQRSFDKPMVMTLAEEPYTVVQVNKLWEEMTGYKAEEVVGKASCRILEGEETDPSAVEVLMNEIRFKRPASAMIVNYKKTGERFRNFFLAYPLSTDSRITHYLLLSNHVDVGIGSKAPSNALTVQPSQQGMLNSPNPESSTGTAAPQASQSQPNLFNSLQNLPGSVNTVQPSLAHPGSQALFSLPPGLSNSLATTPSQGAMLPPGLGASGANGAIQQYPLTGLKRTHESNSDSNEPQKQQKINDTIGNTKLVPPTHQK